MQSKMVCLPDRAHLGQQDKPDKWVHISDAGYLGNEQALRHQ